MLSKDVNEVIHLPDAPTEQEKYSYIIKKPIVLKVLYTISMLSWCGVLYGYFQFFNNNILYYLFIAPIVIYLTVYKFLSIFINLFYKKFDREKHEQTVKTFWENNKTKYKINIFLPVCGEDIRVLRNTWEGVNTLNNSKYDLEPVVLDDMDHPEVRKLAKEFNFRYIVRPNRGEMKKAGNLKYGFEQTDGDFLVILDADFKPRSDFLIDTVPYMENPKIGIIQTPQFFDNHSELHRRSPLTSGAGNIQEYFYRIIQNSRNTFGGSICVGSCALYRRKALEEVGGTAQVEHSEDVHTGFSLVDKGWTLKYMPLPLSKGVCPEDMHSFFKQQTRWCSGSMSMMVNPKFWKSKISVLTKMCYISGFMFYISNPLSLILTFQTFLLLAFHSDSLGTFNLAIFIPLILCSGVLQYFYIYKHAKPGTVMAHACTVWFYSFTLFGLMFGHVEGWKPTGAKSSLSRGFTGLSRFTSVYLVTYLTLVLIMSAIGKMDFTNILLYPIICWATINTLYHTYFWLNIQSYVRDNHVSSIGFLKARKTVYKTVVVGLLLAIVCTIVGQFSGMVNTDSKTKANQVALSGSPEIENTAGKATK
jgi:cellulose synthase (UDP-forming)